MIFLKKKKFLAFFLIFLFCPLLLVSCDHIARNTETKKIRLEYMILCEEIRRNMLLLEKIFEDGLKRNLEEKAAIKKKEEATVFKDEENANILASEINLRERSLFIQIRDFSRSLFQFVRNEDVFFNFYILLSKFYDFSYIFNADTMKEFDKIFYDVSGRNLKKEFKIFWDYGHRFYKMFLGFFTFLSANCIVSIVKKIYSGITFEHYFVLNFFETLSRGFDFLLYVLNFIIDHGEKTFFAHYLDDFKKVKGFVETYIKQTKDISILSSYLFYLKGPNYFSSMKCNSHKLPHIYDTINEKFPNFQTIYFEKILLKKMLSYSEEKKYKERVIEFAFNVVHFYKSEPAIHAYLLYGNKAAQNLKDSYDFIGLFLKDLYFKNNAKNYFCFLQEKSDVEDETSIDYNILTNMRYDPLTERWENNEDNKLALPHFNPISYNNDKGYLKNGTRVSWEKIDILNLNYSSY